MGVDRAKQRLARREGDVHTTPRRPSPLPQLIGNRATAELMRAPTAAGPKVQWAIARITGEKQRQFGARASGHARDGEIEVHHVKSGGKSPRDKESGQATGKRAYDPVSFQVTEGESFEQIRNAFVSNESLEITLAFFRQQGDGAPEHYRSAAYTGCSISDITEEDDTATVSFVFQKIESTSGSSSSSDDWAAPTT